MKYLILSLLALSACTSAPKAPEPELFWYECAFLTGHGVQGKVRGQATSEVAATREAELARLDAVKRGLVGDNTFTMCYPSEQGQPEITESEQGK